MPYQYDSDLRLRLPGPGAASPDEARAAQELVARLRRFAGELLQRDERMRRRIAADLHDGPAQGLVAAQLELSLLERRGVASARDLDRLKRALESATRDVRTLMAELAPTGLSEPKIGAGLGELARHFGRTQGITIEARDDGSPKPLDADARILLYQCVRELLRNAVEHGRTVWIGVRSRLEDGLIVVEVEDRGAGFEPAGLDGPAGHGGGFGLFGVRERLKMLRGTLRIRSSAGSGTLVTLSLPMQREAE